jgi:FkbM family methyltransferase
MIRFYIKIISIIWPDSLEIIEEYSQRLQGKGDGAVSIEHEVNSLTRFFDVNSQLIILDIGANIGNYAYYLLEQFPNATIHCFEPSKMTFAKLQERYEKEKRVKLHNIAIGNSDGVEKLYSDQIGSGLASLSKRDLTYLGIDFDLAEVVQVSKLDTFVNDWKIDLDIIKIDVEGHEMDVIRGGINAMQRAKLVQFEFGGANLSSRTQFKDFWDTLTKIGFTIYRIKHKGQLIRINAYNEMLETYRTSNYIGVK